MVLRGIALLVVGLVLALAGEARAADPPKKDEVLPKLPQGPLPPVKPNRVDRYAVWQCYDVDRFGHWRPLVVNTPWGAYYRSNGQCYPWVETHPLEMLRRWVE